MVKFFKNGLLCLIIKHNVVSYVVCKLAARLTRGNFKYNIIRNSRSYLDIVFKFQSDSTHQTELFGGVLKLFIRIRLNFGHKTIFIEYRSYNSGSEFALNNNSC